MKYRKRKGGGGTMAIQPSGNDNSVMAQTKKYWNDIQRNGAYRWGQVTNAMDKVKNITMNSWNNTKNYASNMWRNVSNRFRSNPQTGGKFRKTRKLMISHK